MKHLFCAVVTFLAYLDPAFAQTPQPQPVQSAEQRIAIQIGTLVIQNSQLATQVEQLVVENARLKAELEKAKTAKPE